MPDFLKPYLNRYALFDTIVLAAAIAFGFFTGKIVYESRCAEMLGDLIPVTERALAAHQHADSATLDTLDMLPARPAPDPLTETDDR